MTSKSNRLHGAAIILFGFKTFKDRFFLFFALFVVGFEFSFSTYIIIGLLVLIGLIAFFSWLKWYRFTYSLEGTDLKIEHGILIRKKRTISKYRIQSINLNQNILHRMLGLTGLQIETAGSDLDVDANLLTLKRSIAEELRKALKIQKDSDDQPEEYDYDYALEKQLPKYEASYKRLFAFGSTSGGFGLIVVVILFIFSEAVNFVPEQIYDQTTTWLLNQAITTIIVLSFLIIGLIWFISVFGSVIKYGDFTIVRYDQELYITRGLWEKKQLTIPLKRIQAVSFKQNPLRLPFKFGSLSIVIAGGEVSQKEQIQTIIFPLIKQSEMNTFLQTILPEYDVQFEQLKPISKKYFYFRSSLYLFISLIITSIVAFFFPSFWWIGLGLFIFTCGYQFANYKLTKTDLSEEQLTLQVLSNFSKETVCIVKDRIQALEQRQSLIQRKLKIANHKVSVLDNFVGQHFLVNGLPINDAEKMTDWYSYRGAYKLEDIKLTNK